ncbi:hypothetical protein J2W42_003071 [Rhizobium tibeticum]|uniref:hypothetical protein n=1 Tax=Rhizobium tibeticum TaxID=501024 RepID=UPI000A73F18A|nr:hypothetical protein [Rhizobium tibeticum]MDP9810210.1 hypothetical protein [Rhizobium tibeticum]
MNEIIDAVAERLVNTRKRRNGRACHAGGCPAEPKRQIVALDGRGEIVALRWLKGLNGR